MTESVEPVLEPREHPPMHVLRNVLLLTGLAALGFLVVGALTFWASWDGRFEDYFEQQDARMRNERTAFVAPYDNPFEPLILQAVETGDWAIVERERLVRMRPTRLQVRRIGQTETIWDSHKSDVSRWIAGDNPPLRVSEHVEAIALYEAKPPKNMALREEIEYLVGIKLGNRPKEVGHAKYTRSMRSFELAWASGAVAGGLLFLVAGAWVIWTYCRELAFEKRKSYLQDELRKNKKAKANADSKISELEAEREPLHIRLAELEEKKEELEAVILSSKSSDKDVTNSRAELGAWLKQYEAVEKQLRDSTQRHAVEVQTLVQERDAALAREREKEMERATLVSEKARTSDIRKELERLHKDLQHAKRLWERNVPWTERAKIEKTLGAPSYSPFATFLAWVALEATVKPHVSKDEWHRMLRGLAVVRNKWFHYGELPTAKEAGGIRRLAEENQCPPQI